MITIEQISGRETRSSGEVGLEAHRTIDELVEFLLRIIQSVVIAPHDPPRSGAELRAYLHRWIGPALAARTD
jgi:hypothetical protein